MTQVKLILLALVGAFCVCNVNGASFHLDKKTHDDLLTQDIITYRNVLSDMNEEEQQTLSELSHISDQRRRMKVAKEKLPKLYEAVQTLTESTESHVRFMDNKDAARFYKNYLNKVRTVEDKPGNKNKNYAEFLKTEISNFNELDEEAQKAFSTEFPEIGKILKDESIGEKLNGGGASDDQGEESSSGTGTEHESTGSETQESKPAMGFWRQLTLFG